MTPPAHSLALLALVACTAAPSSPGPHKLDDTSSGTAATAATADAGSDTADASDSGSAGACDNPAYTCAEPYACAGSSDCGPLAPVDAAGCLRRSCTTDADCGDAERCYEPARFGQCDVVAITGCSDDDGPCTCTYASGDPAFCVDAADHPDGPEQPCSTECGGPGTHSSDTMGECRCDPGFTWCVPDDPVDYRCCPI